MECPVPKSKSKSQVPSPKSQVPSREAVSENAGSGKSAKADCVPL